VSYQLRSASTRAATQGLQHGSVILHERPRNKRASPLYLDPLASRPLNQLGTTMIRASQWPPSQAMSAMRDPPNRTAQDVQTSAVIAAGEGEAGNHPRRAMRNLLDRILRVVPWHNHGIDVPTIALSACDSRRSPARLAFFFFGAMLALAWARVRLLEWNKQLRHPIPTSVLLPPCQHAQPSSQTSAEDFQEYRTAPRPKRPTFATWWAASKAEP